MSSERKPPFPSPASRRASGAFRRAVVLTGTLLIAGETLAGGQSGLDDAMFQGAVAMQDQELQEIRGGFVPPQGAYEISFGIERSVSINDELQAVTTLHLSGLPGRGSWSLSLDGSNLIQNGPLNFSPSNLPEIVQVVQNSLDQQKISIQTVVNVAVSNLQQYRAAGMNDLVRTGLIGSLR